jgi:hypothetical protein
MAGDWKRLKRISGDYDRLSEPAYLLSDNQLTILLSSDVCDAYDQLDGTVANGTYTANHSAYGLGSAADLGTARGVRVK